MLAVITSLFNPAGFRRTASKYREFLRQLQYEHVFTAELSWTGQFESDNGIRLRGDQCHVMWQKERLLNLALDNLPGEFDKVAWIDADIIFLEPNWWHEADSRLDEYPVAQLFDGVIDLGADGHGRTITQSWAHGNLTTEPDVRIHHVGHAWAARRETIAEGLFDKMITGGADWLMADAWTHAELSPAITSQLTAGLNESYAAWAERQYQRVQGQIACVPGKILHLHHGEKKFRRYNSRYTPLIEHSFNPETDITLDEQGLWQWATPNSELHEQIAGYFSLRNEDGDASSSPANGERLFATMTVGERTCLEKHLAQAKHYLEFGFGASTVLAAQCSNIEIIDSVESDEGFARRCIEKNPDLRSNLDRGRLNLRCVDIGPTAEWGYPKDPSTINLWPRYADVIRSLGRTWDTILIDGRFRVACVCSVLLVVDESAELLIHDFWNREHYHHVLAFLEPQNSVDSLGVFRKRSGCSVDAVQRMLRQYATDPR